MNAAEMKVLRDEAEKTRIDLFFWTPVSIYPAVRTARDVIAEGRLGKIYRARATGSVRGEFPLELACGSLTRSARAVVRLSTLEFTRSTLRGT